MLWCSPYLICKLLVFICRNVWSLYRVQNITYKNPGIQISFICTHSSLIFFFFYYDAFVYNKSQSDKYSVYTSEAKTVLYICLFVVSITFGALIHVNHQNGRSLTLYAESQILLHTSACDLWFCNPFITRII